MENSKIDNILEKEEKNKLKNNINIKYNNSIQFINDIEKIYIDNKNLKEKQLYEKYTYKNNNSKENIKVINSIPKTSLSSLIYKKGIIITCMTIKLNNIYIGTNKGEIRVYNWKNEKKLDYLINSEVGRENKRDVICMDASEDNKALVVGHLNGFILLWDVNSTECKKLINDEFNSEIIAIKFTLIENNNFYEFLASDLKGSVKRLGVNNNSDEIEEPLIVAFGSLDFVFIVQLEPEIKRLYNFKKPSYIKGSFIPDICFGIGRIPSSFYYSKDLSKEEMKKIKKEDLKIKIKNNIDITNNYQFIFVSWGKVIYIFMISFDLDDFLSINLVGYYINNEPITRMGYLSNNIIFIMNIYKKFKILNTSFMNSGEIKMDNEGNLIVNNLSKAELCSEFSLDYDILFQTYIPDPYNNSPNSYKSTYNNVVIIYIFRLSIKLGAMYK